MLPTTQNNQNISSNGCKSKILKKSIMIFRKPYNTTTYVNAVVEDMKRDIDLGDRSIEYYNRIAFPRQQKHIDEATIALFPFDPNSVSFWIAVAFSSISLLAACAFLLLSISHSTSIQNCSETSQHFNSQSTNENINFYEVILHGGPIGVIIFILFLWVKPVHQSVHR